MNEVTYKLKKIELESQIEQDYIIENKYNIDFLIHVRIASEEMVELTNYSLDKCLMFNLYKGGNPDLLLNEIAFLYNTISYDVSQTINRCIESKKKCILKCPDYKANRRLRQYLEV